MTDHTAYQTFSGPLRPTPMTDWIEQALGPVILRPLSAYHSWEALAPDGTKYTVRRLPDARAYQRETYAHRDVLSALNPTSAPRLVAASHPRLALITTALQGIPVTRTRLTRDSRIHTYRSAGALLAELHHARRPTAPSLITAHTAFRRTADSTHRLITLIQPSPLSADEHTFVGERLAQLRTAEATEIGFIHGAFTEDAWIRSTSTRRLALADFSASHYAPAVYDLVDIACRWGNPSPRRTAFFDGYGRRLSAPEHQVLLSLVTLRCATRIVRSHDYTSMRTSRDVLGRLMNGAPI